MAGWPGLAERLGVALGPTGASFDAAISSPPRFDGCAERALARCGGTSTGDVSTAQQRASTCARWKPPVTLVCPSVVGVPVALAPRPSVVGVPRPFVCAVPGCGKDYVDQGGLYQHYMDQHGLTAGQLNEAVERVTAGRAAAERAAVAASEEASAPVPAYVSAPASSSPSELGRCGTFGCALLDGHAGLCNTGLHARSEEEIFMQEISEIHAVEISEGATPSPSTDDLPELEERVLGETVRDFWTTF